MDLLLENKGHVVYLRCVTVPESWESACRCGFRSDRVRDKQVAAYEGIQHAQNSEPWRDPNVKATRKRARKR